ncbi:MAG: hypothetical protein A3E83_07415 [Gammaproteobacteria bacterium RIFCSPHIGHO2_12_FULL_41_20]|nr:MAG: hypothetical protein A3E83_07415 [Gammaproteobacteria bacterium RIFCSPHIGHO2_12_FULL_41_20]
MYINYRLLSYILISIIALYFIFAPAIHALYYAEDDFRYTFGAMQSCRNGDGFGFMSNAGRPLQAYMSCLNFKFAYTLERMSVVRFTAVTLMGIGMGLLADWLCSLGFSLGSAFFTAGLFFMIQRLYGDTVLTGATSLPFAVLFSIIGYWYADKNRWLLAAIFILCALLTYPAMTFFYGSLLLLKIAFSPLSAWYTTRKTLLKELGLFIGICIIYFIWAHFSSNPSRLPEQYRIEPNINLLEIGARLLPLMNFFDAGPWKWPLTQPLWQGWIVIVLLIGGLLSGAIHFICQHNDKDKHVSINCLIQIIFMFLIIFILCSGFYLIIPGRENMGSRLLFATVASGFPVIVWCIYQISAFFSLPLRSRIILFGTGLLFFTAAYKANLVTTIDALNYAQYMDKVKNSLESYLHTGNRFKHIHYIVPEPGYPYNKFFLTHAVLQRVPSLQHYMLVWCSSTQDRHTIIQCLQAISKDSIAVTYSRPADAFVKTSSMLILQNYSTSAGKLFGND